MALSHPLSSLSCCLPLRSGRGCRANLSGRRARVNPISFLRLKAPQSPSAAQSSGAASVAKICDALAAAAGENNLPVDFFARLIWQESRFDPTAVSRAGAQGVAQFMPATANSRGLADPFDPIESIAHSAKLLSDLRRELGNLGLAAAA